MISSNLLIPSLLLMPTLVAYAISTYRRNVAEKEDFISQLPDDVLLSIIERVCPLFPIKVAVRTSILSKRWKDLFKFIPDVWLRFKDLYPHHCINEDEGIFSKMETFLSLYSGHRIPRIFLSFCSCVSCSSHMSRLDHLLYFLEKLGAEYLYLDWVAGNGKFSMPCNMLPRLPSLKLSTCTLQPDTDCLTQYRNSSLRFLTLRCVTLLPDSLRCVLLNCFALESLSISNCKCPLKLSISGRNLQLKTLIINLCIGLEEVEIYATNLLRFECYGHTNIFECCRTNMINYIFAHVPQLQTVYLVSDKETSRMSSVFGTLARDMPQLKFLSVNFESEIDCHQRRTGTRVMRSMSAVGLTTFRNLRRLAIFNPNLATVAPILQSCPLLEELHVNMCEFQSNGEIVREDGARLLKLKRVKFSEFAGTKNDREFCLYILKSAVILEEMLICRCAMVYRGDGSWSRGLSKSRNPWNDELYKIIQQLQQKAISPAAQLNLVHVFP